jgi:hypothetical protein
MLVIVPALPAPMAAFGRSNCAVFKQLKHSQRNCSHALTDAEVLEEREVDLHEARTIQDVPAGVAIDKGRRGRECRHVEPAVHAPAPAGRLVLPRDRLAGVDEE